MVRDSRRRKEKFRLQYIRYREDGELRFLPALRWYKYSVRSVAGITGTKHYVCADVGEPQKVTLGAYDTQDVAEAVCFQVADTVSRRSRKYVDVSFIETDVRLYYETIAIVRAEVNAVCAAE